MGLTYESPSLSPRSSNRQKITKRVETQIEQQTRLKTEQEVIDLVSKSRNQSGPGSQDEPINQRQSVNQDQLVDQVQIESYDQLKERFRREGIYLDSEDISYNPRIHNLEAHNERLRKQGWAQGKREEAQFRRDYRFDDFMSFYNRIYKTPENSEVSRGPNSYWDTRNFIIDDRSTRKKIIELEKGQSKDSRLRRLMRRNQKDAAESNRFLQAHKAELGPNWKGVKVLGKGGQGIVGLWEYTGSDSHKWGKKVVIKMSLKYPFNHEREMMMLMGNDDPEVNHVSKLLYPTYVDPGRRDRDIEKMVLEFCEGGDLYSFIIKQRKRGYYFNEQNLWYFFACLVKGLNIMDHGDENPEGKLGSRHPICHFDLKPANILIGKKDDGEHQQYPILKIADYGLAEVIDPTDYIDIARGRGTRGYLLPEQFSKRWAYDDAAKTGHVNVWGTHSNIWSVGVVMYMLATLSGPPRPKGFRCALIGRKFTYGYKLKAIIISNPLKRLIWQCLCDKPKERPSLRNLNKEIQSSLEAIKMQMKDLPLGIECDEPQDPDKSVEWEEKEMKKGKEKESEKATETSKDGQVLIEDPHESTVKPKQQAVKGTGTGTGTGTGKGKGKDAQDLSQDRAPRRAPLRFPYRGFYDAPILIRGSGGGGGGAALTKSTMLIFSVVLKYLPFYQQTTLWFAGSIDLTVKQVKRALRVEAGVELSDEEQFLYYRTSAKRAWDDKPDVLLSNPDAMLWSGYRVGSLARLELWGSRGDHDLHEPDETDFEVV